MVFDDPINAEARKNLRNRIAEILEDLADPDRTRMEWNGKVPGVMRSYTEDVCAFFDDILGGRDLRWNVEFGLLTRQEADGLQRFYEIFSKFVADNESIDEFEIDITNLAEWQEVAHAAKQASEEVGDRLRS